MLSESGTFLEVYARREHQRALDLFARRSASVFYAHSMQSGREDDEEEEEEREENNE
jgi:hypothetical protein